MGAAADLGTDNSAVLGKGAKAGVVMKSGKGTQGLWQDMNGDIN